MLDKLALSSPRHCSSDEVCCLLDGQYLSYTRTGSRYHKEVLVFYDYRKSHLVTINLEPRFLSASALKIELNPSRFSSYKQLIRFIEVFDDPFKLKISRLDCCVDINHSLSDVYNCLIWTRKKAMEKNHEDYPDGYSLSGYYLGRSPELLNIYDKARESKQEGILTRIELRQANKKVPISNLQNLTELLNIRPFKNIEFRSVDPSFKRTECNQKKVVILNDLLNKYGAQGAFKRLNRHSNFKRDYENLFVQDTRFPDLDYQFHNNIKSFIEGANDN